MIKRETSYHTYNAEKDWQNVNKQNKELVKEYLEYLSATDKSPDTKEKYFHNLKLFFQWVLNEKDNIFFAKLKKRDFMSWLSYLVSDQELSSSRVRTLRSTVSSLSNFCENILADEDDKFENYRNLILKIPAPPLENKREKTFLTDEQIEQLLDILEAKQDWQKCLYIVMSFYTGARKGEVMQFKRSDFTKDTTKNKMYNTSMKRAKGRGKQGNKRIFRIPCDLVDKYLKLYLDSRKDDLDDLFVVKYKGELKPVSEGTFNSWCNKFSDMLGVNVYPHCYRSSIATVLKNRGKNTSNIQKMLGHKDLTTTMIYIKQDDELDIEELYDIKPEED